MKWEEELTRVNNRNEDNLTKWTMKWTENKTSSVCEKDIKKLERSKPKIISPDTRKRVFLDKQPSVIPPETKIYPSKNVGAFNRASPGLYSQTILDQVNISGVTYSVDPGMHDIMSSVKNESAMADPSKWKHFSSKEFYNQLGQTIKIKKGDRLNTIISKASLKSITPAVICENIKSLVTVAEDYFKHFGSKCLRKVKFSRFRRKSKLYATFADKMFPEKNSIVLMGDGKIQTTLKGLATCPIAKLTQTVSKSRRVIFIKEYYTTQKCSYCCDINCNVTAQPDNKKGMQTNRFGKAYMPTIHGLRQCPHCAKTWNRDTNAARNICFAAYEANKTGLHPKYLNKVSTCRGTVPRSVDCQCPKTP